MISSLWPGGFAARAPATPALSRVASASQPRAGAAGRPGRPATGSRCGSRCRSTPCRPACPAPAKADDHLLGVRLDGLGELGEVLALPGRGDVLVLRVGPEVRVQDVQVELHPGRPHLPGQLQVAGQVAVAGRRVHPQPQADVVGAVVPHDVDRAARPSVVGEMRSGRDFLRGEGQVCAAVHARGGRVRPEHPELAYADRRTGPAVDGQPGEPGVAAAAGAGRYDRLARIQCDAPARPARSASHPAVATPPRSWRRRTARAVQRDAQVGQGAYLARDRPCGCRSRNSGTSWFPRHQSTALAAGRPTRRTSPWPGRTGPSSRWARTQAVAAARPSAAWPRLDQPRRWPSSPP